MASGDTTLNELIDLLARLRREKAKAQQKLTELDEQLAAVEVTMRLLGRNGKLGVPDEYESLVSELQGKTQLDALLTIAGKSDNHLKATDAKRLMLQAGLLRNPKTALSMIYTVINRSGRFEKVRPGEYKVLSSQGDQTSPYLIPPEHHEPTSTQ